MTDLSISSFRAAQREIENYKKKIELLEKENERLRAYKEEELKERSIIESHERDKKRKDDINTYGLIHYAKHLAEYTLEENEIEFYIDTDRCKGTNPCSHIVRCMKRVNREYVEAEVMTADEIYDLCKKHGKEVPFHIKEIVDKE